MKYGLIGEKLGHSFSKEIHERIANYTYDLMPLTKQEFPIFMAKHDFNAINVTIPYKRDVIPYLDEIDEHAQAIGAVNTIVNKDGKLKGYNTDVLGFLYMMDKYQVDVANKKVIVVGNGGASAAIQAALKHKHAGEIIIVDIILNGDAISYEECYQNHHDAKIIVNTSPVGMFPKISSCPINIDAFDQLEAVLDVIYNPLKTSLTLQAKRKNLIYANGLEMLIAQAKYAVEFFLDQEIDDAIIETIYQDMIKQRQNIVLIGMPSSGKTTIAKALADHFNMPLIDMDEEIIKKAQMSIPDIFAKYQEEGFRKLESEVALEVSKLNGVIISCGGGIIKKEENMNVLGLNGIVYFINRNLEYLIADDPNRPLSSSKEAVKKMYFERIDLYRKYSDVIIDNNQSLDETIKAIVSHINK